ncbi:MAG: electron transfer flavoprotein subunit alpha/FixB family protein [Fimbriimonadaceae bacterium]
MILVVAFHPGDASAGGAFASAVGEPFSILTIPEDAPPADAVAADIASRAHAYAYITSASSMAAKDVLARVAGLLDAPMVTDAIGLAGPNQFKRPSFAGAIVETVRVTGSPIIVTFRPAGFPESEAAPQSAEVATPTEGVTKRVASGSREGGRPDLAQAKRIVSGGKPLRDAATFEAVIGGLADAIGGAVGATRAAVDSGIAPNDIQIGQTGKVVAPDLYIAAGISGSTQHIAGIKDAKVIVAINRDPSAPIFEVADLGLVADLFDAVPALTAKLKA